MRQGRAIRALVAFAAALLLALSLSVASGTSSWADNLDDQHRELNEQVQRDGDGDLDDLGDRIPPVLMDGTQKLDPHLLDPVDPASIEITTVTPADRFIRATTPLLVALTLGALGLFGLAISQAVRKRSAGEIRLGE